MLHSVTVPSLHPAIPPTEETSMGPSVETLPSITSHSSMVPTILSAAMPPTRFCEALFSLVPVMVEFSTVQLSDGAYCIVCRNNASHVDSSACCSGLILSGNVAVQNRTLTDGAKIISSDSSGIARSRLIIYCCFDGSLEGAVGDFGTITNKPSNPACIK